MDPETSSKNLPGVLLPEALDAGGTPIPESVPAPPRIPGEQVRLLDDQDRDRTFTVVEVAPVGKTGKQFRCSLMDDRTHEILTGIAPSRLADPYKGPRVYNVGDTIYSQDMKPSPTIKNPHPAIALAPMLSEPDRQTLHDLIKTAAIKDTSKAHAEVVIFCTRRVINPEPRALTFGEKLASCFTGKTVPDPEINRAHLLLAVAKLHASLFDGKE